MNWNNGMKQNKVVGSVVDCCDVGAVMSEKKMLLLYQQLKLRFSYCVTVLIVAAKERRECTIFELNINSGSCCCQAEVKAEAGIRCSIGCISWQATMTTKVVGKASAATGGADGG